MNRLPESDVDQRDGSHSGGARGSAPDREISLGTPTILGFFFALALVCAVFFGFGYTLGRKSAQSATQNGPQASSTSASPASNIKPTAGSPSASPRIALDPATPLPTAAAPPPSRPYHPKKA